MSNLHQSVLWETDYHNFCNSSCSNTVLCWIMRVPYMIQTPNFRRSWTQLDPEDCCSIPYPVIGLCTFWYSQTMAYGLCHAVGMKLRKYDAPGWHLTSLTRVFVFKSVSIKFMNIALDRRKQCPVDAPCIPCIIHPDFYITLSEKAVNLQWDNLKGEDLSTLHTWVDNCIFFYRSTYILASQKRGHYIGLFILKSLLTAPGGWVTL